MSNIQARLAAFESESGLVIPADLAEHFRLLKEGKREVWKDMYQLYSFDAFKSVPTGVALFRGIPDYRGIVDTLDRCEDCFGFADWMIMSFAYAIRLYREPTAINEVYVIYKDEFKKIVETKGIYNLAFGNIGTNNSLDDGIISNNGDRNEILATVAKAVDKYTQRYPRRWIYFRGNTPGRTRLYRMAIGINLKELSKKFEIFAEVDGEDVFK